MCAWEQWAGDFGKFHISIYKNGHIGFSRLVKKKINLIKNSFVSVFFDTETKRMGFKFHEDEGPNRYKVNERSSYSLSISVSNTLRYYRIDFSSTRRSRLHKEGDMLVTDPLVMTE